jgi:hypothetical protein
MVKNAGPQFKDMLEDNLNIIQVQNKFFDGYGTGQVPTNNQWKTALILNLQQLVNYGYFFYVNGNEVTIYNLTCASSSEPITLQINVGVNIDISCQ